MMQSQPSTDDLVACLVCSRRMKFLGTHIKRVHGMSAKGYRETFDLPASTPLASASYCEQARQRIVGQIESGSMQYDHLPRATAAARDAGRGYIASSIKRLRSDTATRSRPGDAHMLPPGAKRADGRNVERARIAQQRRRRARKSEVDARMG